IFFCTKQGKVKKTELEAYSHPRAGGIQAIGLEDGDTVITARRTDGNREVMIATKLGMAIRFPENEVRPMGRGAAGVRGIDVDDVSSQGRNTMGVRIIDLDADDKVGSIARVEAETSAPAETP